MIEFTEEPKTRLEIYTFLCEHGKKLRSNSDFRYSITLWHKDESKFCLNNCSWDEGEKRIYIWTEHCGYFYFYKDDLEKMEVERVEWSEEEDHLKTIEHKIINFDMEVKPDGTETNQAEE